jgi:hypothetical protein
MSPETSKPDLFLSIFTSFKPLDCAFPDSSLAVTSTLGNIFLALKGSSQISTTAPSLLSTGRRSLFYSYLIQTSPAIFGELENIHDDKIPELMLFLFLHVCFVKDKLSFADANSLWSEDSSIGEIEFMGFQRICFDFLENVCPHLV